MPAGRRAWRWAAITSSGMSLVWSTRGYHQNLIREFLINLPTVPQPTVDMSQEITFGQEISFINISFIFISCRSVFLVNLFPWDFLSKIEQASMDGLSLPTFPRINLWFSYQNDRLRRSTLKPAPPPPAIMGGNNIAKILSFPRK